MNTELTSEERAKLQEVLNELRSNHLSLHDKNAIGNLAQKLAVTKSGWLDVDICTKAQPVEAFTSYPDNFFMQYYPEFFRFLRAAPRHFWFTITIPKGVSVDDPFILNHKLEHFDNMEKIRKLIYPRFGGEILYYEIDSQCIMGIVKIMQPVEDNVPKIQQIIQNSIDGLFEKYNSVPNVAWKVSMSWIEVYDDIRVTLQNKNMYMK